MALRRGLGLADAAFARPRGRVLYRAHALCAAPALWRYAAPDHGRVLPPKKHSPRGSIAFAGDDDGAGSHGGHGQYRRRRRGHRPGRAGRGVLDVGVGLSRHGHEVRRSRPRRALSPAGGGRDFLRRADVLYPRSGQGLCPARAPLRPARRAGRLWHRQYGAGQHRRGGGRVFPHGIFPRFRGNAVAPVRGASAFSGGRAGANGRRVAHRQGDGTAGAADERPLRMHGADGHPPAPSRRRPRPRRHRDLGLFPARGARRRGGHRHSGGAALRHGARHVLPRGGHGLRAHRPRGRADG